MSPSSPEWSTGALTDSCSVFTCFWSPLLFRLVGVPQLTKSEHLACIYLRQK